MGLEALAAAMEQAAREAVAEACQQTAALAAGLCPVDSGELSGSIVSQVSGTEGMVSATAPHAPFVELGTYKMSAQPFLYPAFAQAKAGVAASIARRICGAL